MGDYAFRILNAALGSELIPARVRNKLMRATGFEIAADTCIWAGANFRSRRVRTGTGVFINVGFYHDGYDSLVIGRNVRIGPFVRIITATHEIGSSEQRGLREVVGRPVRIGNACWICAGVTILPGVDVARGCVIGANSVVHASTRPDGLYVGNPARRVRELDVADAIPRVA